MKVLLRLWLVGWLLVPGGAVWAEGIFQTEPKDLTVPAGCTALFTADIDRNYERIRVYTYQWYLGGEAVPGATTRKYGYHTTEVTAEPALYWLVVTNAGLGLLHTSRVATLTVGEPGPCVADFPKIRLGKQNVSLMVKAERFLPLVLLDEIIPKARQMVGVTNLTEQRALCFGLNPWYWNDDFTWEQAQETKWSETFLWKNTLGINSVVMGYYSSNGPVLFSQTGGGIMHSNGLYQRRCALITPRFTLTHGHAPPPKYAAPTAAAYEWVDWHDEGPSGSPLTNRVFAQNGGHVSYFYPTNFVCWFRFVGTNNDVHWRYLLKEYDYWNGQYDWPATNVGIARGLSICLLNEDLPPSVVPVSLMPTNLYDYAKLDGKIFNLPTVWLDRHNWAVMDCGILGWAAAIPSHFKDSWLGPPSGNSSHPVFHILDGRCVERSITAPQQELLIAAMRHMWNAVTGQPEETCQMPTFVDLSRFDKLQ